MIKRRFLKNKGEDRDLGNSKLHHLMINRVKSKAARCFFSPDKLAKILRSFIFQPSYGVSVSLCPVMETEKRLSLTLSNTMVQKGTTVQCQPLRGWYIGHRQRHHRRTTAHTHTATHYTHTHGSTHKLNTFKALLSFSTAIIVQNTCDTPLELKPKKLSHASTTRADDN